MSGSNRPSINLPKFNPSSNNYNPTGLVIHNEASIGKIAESVAFMEARNDLNVQQVVKTDLNVPTPNNSIKSYFSNFFGGEDEKKGANLYTYSEISNLCEPPPSRYEHLPNKELYYEAFCIKSFIPDSKAVSTLKPNDVVTGKFRNESEQSDFIPLDSLGSVLTQISQDADIAASQAFEGAQQAQQLSQTVLSEERDCTSLVGTDFEKFLEPCDGDVGSRFGPRTQPAGGDKGKIIFHPGQDVGIGQGRPVYAMYDGKIVASKKAQINAELANIEKAKKEGKASEEAARNAAKVFGIVRIEHTIVNGLPGVFVDNYSSFKVAKADRVANDGGKTELKAGKYYSQYTHLSAIYVDYGQQVTSGTLIGLIGGAASPYIPGTGRDESGKPLSTGPHLHFELLDEKERRIDPVEVLKWGKTIKAGARCKTLDNPPMPPTSSVEEQQSVDAVASQAIEQADNGLADAAIQTAKQYGSSAVSFIRRVIS